MARSLPKQMEAIRRIVKDIDKLLARLDELVTWNKEHDLIRDIHYGLEQILEILDE